MINFNPIRASIGSFSQTFVTLTCVFHVRVSALILSLSLSHKSNLLSNGAISISRCTKHEQISYIHAI